MRTAHDVANTFDAAGLTLAGVFHGCMEDARARQDAVDHDQALRNASATQRAVFAVERQRAALIATQREHGVPYAVWQCSCNLRHSSVLAL